MTFDMTSLKALVASGEIVSTATLTIPWNDYGVWHGSSGATLNVYKPWSLDYNSNPNVDTVTLYGTGSMYPTTTINVVALVQAWMDGSAPLTSLAIKTVGNNQIGYNASNTHAVLTVTTVPEPVSILMLFSGGLFLARRK
jgi:hypothetical protein